MDSQPYPLETDDQQGNKSWWNPFRDEEVKPRYATAERPIPDDWDLDVFKWWSRTGYTMGSPHQSWISAATRHLGELEDELGIGPQAFWLTEGVGYADENTWWNEFKEHVLLRYHKAGRTFPPAFDWDMFKWWSRTGFDIAQGLPKEVSSSKHMRELEVALGIEPPKADVRIEGQLVLTGNTFAHNPGPVLPILCHAGDLIGQGLVLGLDRILVALDSITDAGYHGLRSWWVCKPQPDNPFWSTKPAPSWDLTPATYPKFVEILRAGVERGLKWHLAAAGIDNMSDAEEDGRFTLLANAVGEVGPENFLLIEACNEVRDTGDEDDQEPEELEQLINIVRSRYPQILYALSAYTGHEDRDVLEEWTPDWMRFYLLHGSRGGHVWDKIRHIFSMGYDGEAPPVRRHGWQGEPCGPGRYVSVTENKHELDDEALALMAAMSAMARQAWNYMCSPGIIYDEPFTSMPGFASVPRLMAALPQDVMTYPHLKHGGDTWAHLRPLEAQGAVRCDFSASDSKFMCIVYGPTGHYNIRVARSFTGEVIHPATGDRTTITAHAGQTIPFNFTWGRVVVGTFI